MVRDPLKLARILLGRGAPFELPLEPTSDAVSTGHGPWNRLRINEALVRLKGPSPQLDLQLYHRLVTELTLTDEEQAYLSDRNELETQACKIRNLLALDLKDSDQAVRLYLYPMLKSAATQTNARLTNDLQLSPESGWWRHFQGGLGYYDKLPAYGTSECISMFVFFFFFFFF